METKVSIMKESKTYGADVFSTRVIISGDKEVCELITKLLENQFGKDKVI